MKRHSIKLIISVTQDGIKYLDDSGLEGFIDFKECNENWIQYRKRKEDLDDATITEIKESDKRVGQRDICANPCFIGVCTPNCVF